MGNLHRWTMSLVFFFTLMTSGQGAATPLEAEEVLKEGLRVNDELISFLDAHACEVGMVPNCDRPLSPSAVLKLKSLFLKLHDWKNETFSHLVPLHDLLAGREFVLKTARAHSVIHKDGKLIISIAPDDSASERFLDSVLISASSRMVMFDSFFRLSVPLSKAKKMRSILSSDLGLEGGVFLNTFLVALDPKQWKRAEVDLSFLRETERYRPEVTSFFEQYLQNSFTALSIREKNQFYKMKSILFLGTILSHTELLSGLEKIMGKVSELFGNSIGTIQTRDGKLKKLAQDNREMKRLKGKLKPLDILFEKTPFRLTDQFIPGFYGHVAIWLGTPQELSEMEVWYQGHRIPLLHHPVVLPHLEKLSQGKLVLEALRKPGVTMNALESFMDIDDFMVLSPGAVEAPGEHIVRALEMFGRPYDFNFDVETDNAIVCSELIFRVFDQHEWPTTFQMGRHTISPDHIAWKALDSCFDPVVMFHDGKEVTQNPSGHVRRLLGARGGISYTPSGSCL